MDKSKEIFGIDISKDVFDVYHSKLRHQSYANDKQGFSSFLKMIPKDSLVVMEATGYYHYRFAQFLDNHKVQVSVVNPLSVKRFIQMKLAKVKTDKSDARAICEYAQMNEVPLYTAMTAVQAECLQLFRLLDSYVKKSTQTKNKLHGEEVLGLPSKYVYSSLKRDTTLRKRNQRNRISHIIVGKTGTARAVDAFKIHTRIGGKNGDVFNSCNRWF